VAKSVIDAVRMGDWDFEVPEVAPSLFEASDAMPGTRDKVDALAERVAAGLPLWHEADRYDAEAPSPPRVPR
jgi:hypothetical protein